MQESDSKLYKAIGSILRKKRLEKNLKFTIFCYENDIPKSTLHVIEKGGAQTYFSKIAKVTKALNLSFEELGRLLDEELPENYLANE